MKPDHCYLCEWQGTTEFLEMSRLDNALCMLVSILLTIPITLVWWLAIGIDKAIDFFKSNEK
jgi:hypothetical protein